MHFGLRELSVFVKRSLRQNRAKRHPRDRRCADPPCWWRPFAHHARPCGRRQNLFSKLFLLALVAACATKQERPVNSGPDEPVRLGMAPSSGTGPEPVERPAPSAPSEPVPRAVSSEPQESLPHYPFDAVHSPITKSVGEQIQEVAARHPERKADRFSKIGDSITRSPKFMTCLADVEADRVDEGVRETLRALLASPFDSFRRESSCAENGWSAWQPLAGRTPPLFRELGEVQGLFAFVLLGTNDIETSRVTTFARRFARLVDATLAQGAVPLLSTIPERRDRELSRLKVPRFNAVIRAIAQARGVPLVDLHHALGRLPNEGLASDGIHPSVLSVGGKARACDFGPEGLRHGFNVRNWLSLQALERAQRVLESGWLPEPDPASRVVEVEGRLQVAQLPLVDVRALSAEPAGPSGCSKPADRAAREPALSLRYEVTLTRPAFLEVLALESATADSLGIELSSPGTTARCLAAGTGFTRTSLGPGDTTVTVHGKAATAMVGLWLGRSGS